MPRKLSAIAPDWWDYTTLDSSLIDEAARLTARDAASVRERREEQRVDRRHLAEAVEHFLGAFVDERHRAHLNAEHRRFGLL